MRDSVKYKGKVPEHTRQDRHSRIISTVNEERPELWYEYSHQPLQSDALSVIKSVGTEGQFLAWPDLVSISL